MEISRWREPPDTSDIKPAPDGAAETVRFPAHPSGRIHFSDTIRWLAPPANFLSPSG